MGRLSTDDRCETECTGRKSEWRARRPARKIAYETFGLASSAARRRDSCRMLVTESVVRWEFGGICGYVGRLSIKGQTLSR